MSTTRRILTALATFTVAAGLLAVAEAKKPTKVASLDEPVAQNAQAAKPQPKPEKPKPHAKKYLPVANFGDY